MNWSWRWREGWTAEWWRWCERVDPNAIDHVCVSIWGRSALASVLCMYFLFLGNGKGDEILLSFKWHMAKGSFYFYNPGEQPAKERAPKPRQDITEVAMSGTNHTKFVNVHCQAVAVVSPCSEQFFITNHADFFLLSSFINLPWITLQPPAMWA